jgi:hypothetical protein
MEKRTYDSVDLLSGIFILSAIIMSALKSYGVIDISWIIVTLPVWLPTALVSCVVGYFALLTRLEDFAKRDLKKK